MPQTLAAGRVPRFIAMLPLAFVDLETTGATAAADRITEIGIVAVDEAGVREWSRLVNPETPIPGFIQSMTGITDAMVRAAPTFAELAPEVLERLRGRLFIAHNARFDYGFLKNEFRRAGLDFRATVLCTVKLSRKLFPEHRKHSLDALIERHGLAAAGRHRALADAQLIHQFWNLVHDSYPAEGLAAALKELTARPRLPAQLDAAIVDDLPEAPGVYLFYGEGGVPLYVGKGRDIRKRVLAHFAGDQTAGKDLAQQVRRIDWIVTAGEFGAQLREAALVKALQPSHNRQFRPLPELCSIRLVDAGAGPMRPEIVFAGELDFGREAPLYGLFKHAREASTVLAAAQGQGLLQALARLRLKTWPFAGPALIREGDEAHVLDAWRYLGSARTEDEVWALLDGGRPPFDRDIYRILAQATDRMVPLAAPPGWKETCPPRLI